MDICSTKTPQNKPRKRSVATVWWIPGPNGSENGQNGTRESGSKFWVFWLDSKNVGNPLGFPIGWPQNPTENGVLGTPWPRDAINLRYTGGAPCGGAPTVHPILPGVTLRGPPSIPSQIPSRIPSRTPRGFTRGVEGREGRGERGLDRVGRSPQARLGRRPADLLELAGGASWLAEPAELAELLLGLLSSKLIGRLAMHGHPFAGI